MPISSVPGEHIEVRSLNCLMLDALGVGVANLRRRLTPILPAKLVPQALETAGIHGVAGCTGVHAPVSAAPQTISHVGLISGDQIRGPIVPPIPELRNAMQQEHKGTHCKAGVDDMQADPFVGIWQCSMASYIGLTSSRASRGAMHPFRALPG